MALTCVILMHVNGVLALGKIHEVQFDPNLVARGCQYGCSRILSLAGLEVYLHTFVFAQACRSRQCEYNR